VTPNRLAVSDGEASLFLLSAAAIFGSRSDWDVGSRFALLSHVPTFDIDSPSQVVEALRVACDRAGISLSRRRLPSERSIRRAAALARTWAGRGVFVIRRDELKACAAASESIPSYLFAVGSRSPLETPAAAILTSRNTYRTGPYDSQIAFTKEMVASAWDRGCAIVTSYGTVHYCLVSLFAHGSPTVVVCPEVLPFMDRVSRMQRFEVTHAEMFDHDRTVFVSPFPPGRLPVPAERMITRDRLVAALSSVLLVGEVRARGNIEAIVRDSLSRGIPVERFPSRGRMPETEAFLPEMPFRTPAPVAREDSVSGKSCAATHSWDGTSVSPVDSVPPEADREEFPSMEELIGDSRFLIHYTRSCPGPWPGETLTAYYRALIEGSARRGHSAFGTLVRILEHGVILGGSGLTRGGVPVVCFTECLPRELPSIVEWRRGLRRWTFEPYGVGIRKEALVTAGARPVIYATERSFPDLSRDLAYLFQRDDPERKGWSAEREWRLQGDTMLNGFASADVVIIVPSAQEAGIIAARFPWRVGLVCGAGAKAGS
jgi:hypothetical protein